MRQSHADGYAMQTQQSIVVAFLQVKPQDGTLRTRAPAVWGAMLTAGIRILPGGIWSCTQAGMIDIRRTWLKISLSGRDSIWS